MMLQSRRNQYFGINAHLHSYFQAHGGWEGFHNKYIGDLAEAIGDLLPPGYIVDIEQSLQVKEIRDFQQRSRRPKPDITVYETGSSKPIEASRSALITTSPTRIYPVIESLDWDEHKYYNALVIYELSEETELRHAVTWIEVLSPTNKQGFGRELYAEKRFMAIKRALYLVEADYLHETSSFLKGLPQYPDEEGALPYSIAVNYPEPNWYSGEMRVYEFGVDERIPQIEIPLGNHNSINLDWGAIYHKTFYSLSALGYRVDYSRLPDHFERYSPADQARIQRRMMQVQVLAAQGINLETGPFPLED